MDDTVDSAWLSGLSQGDEWTAVIPYEHHNVGGRITQVKVVRRTATQLVTMVGQAEVRFRLPGGVKVGDRWKKIPLPASDETIAAARRENRRLRMVSKLQSMDFRELPYEKLEAVFLILQPQTEQPSAQEPERGGNRAESSK